MLTALRRGPATLIKAWSMARVSGKARLPPSTSRPVANQYAIAARSYHQTPIARQLAAESVQDELPAHDGIFPVITEFQQLSDRNLLDEHVVNTLTKQMGLKTLTPVQSMTITETLKGIDV